MNALLCEKYGREGAFPRPCDLAGLDIDELRISCKVRS